MLWKFSSDLIDSINRDPSFIVDLLAWVVKNNKFSAISSENRLVILLKIYLIKISNLESVDLAIKQIIFIYLMIFLKAYSKASIIYSSYFFPLVSPKPWLSIIIIGLFL